MCEALASTPVLDYTGRGGVDAAAHLGSLVPIRMRRTDPVGTYPCQRQGREGRPGSLEEGPTLPHQVRQDKLLNFSNRILKP